jgi:hypothetical protein
LPNKKLQEQLRNNKWSWYSGLTFSPFYLKFCLIPLASLLASNVLHAESFGEIKSETLSLKLALSIFSFLPEFRIFRDSQKESKLSQVFTNWWSSLRWWFFNHLQVSKL